MEANTKTKFKTTDEYLSTLSKDKRDLMQTMRKTIQEAAPEAQEVISYNMPAFKLNKILVYYAARTNHIGLYPTASGIEMFKKELSDYEYSKGAVQFPFDKPLPLTLISKIVKFRAKENMEKAKAKKK
jgi:uncharacterized protein YdhG (YjbR/CyaY superfamily)